jgi:hypothetical protein
MEDFPGGGPPSTTDAERGGGGVALSGRGLLIPGDAVCDLDGGGGGAAAAGFASSAPACTK